MTGIKKALKKAAVFAIYWGITGSFVFIVNAVVTNPAAANPEREILSVTKKHTQINAEALPVETTAVLPLTEWIENTDGKSQGSEQELASLETVDEKTGDGVKKQVALSFDDGPHPVYTELLLDGLAERNVKAAFFVVGKNIINNEQLIDRMYREGHVIGNHTYDHVKLSEISDEEACIQVEKTNELIYEITGNHVEYVRPPFGEWNHSMECSFTMIPVLWDVDPLDWTTKNQEQIVRHVVEEVEDGDIILLHDYYESSVEAALRIVDELQKQGFEFVTIDRIILE